MMKLLVIGSGGREHALAWKLRQSPRVFKVFVAPGNAGVAMEDGLENLPITDIPGLVEFAKKKVLPTHWSAQKGCWLPVLWMHSVLLA